MILDSNLIIYAAKPEYPGLRHWIATHSIAVSAASKVEVLGYHKLTAEDRQQFENVFAVSTVLPISNAVVARAIVLRQARKMSLGDALIAATALVFRQELLTHNTRDFEGMQGLVVIDPIADGDPV